VLLVALAVAILADVGSKQVAWLEHLLGLFLCISAGLVARFGLGLSPVPFHKISRPDGSTDA